MGERIQCAMVSDSEIRKIVNFVSSQGEQQFDPAVVAADQGKDDGEDDGQDDFLNEVTDQYLQPVMALIEEIRDNIGDEDDGQRELLDEMVYDYLEPLMSLIEEKKEEEKGKAGGSPAECLGE